MFESDHWRLTTSLDTTTQATKVSPTYVVIRAGPLSSSCFCGLVGGLVLFFSSVCIG